MTDKTKKVDGRSRSGRKRKVPEYFKDDGEFDQKAYYEANKTRLSKRSKERVICECGVEVGRGGLYAHKKSKIHVRVMTYKNKTKKLMEIINEEIND